MEIQFLSQGDVFKHPLFNFNLKVSDTDEGIVQTEDMNPKTGEHIFFIGEQLKEEVTLVSTKWGTSDGRDNSNIPWPIVLS